MANINFEDILPWGTTGGDTGLSARLKLKRNFDKIKTWIETGLSEYAKKNEVMTLEQADLRYLSKTVADVAAGHITFEQGLCSILTATFGDYKRVTRGDNTNTGAAVTGDGTGDFLNLRVLQKVLGNLSVEQTIDAINMIFSGVLKSVGADPSFENGTGIYMDATTGKGSFDGLEVRGFMRVMELIINRLQLMESDYSFTEGDTVEHIGYEDNGQTLVLTMKKDHDNDYTPFYPGDIIYAKVNDLLPRDGSVPNGHTATKNGSYYTSWMRVKSVDFTNNQLRVELYAGKNQDNSPRVPGGINFSPHGTALADANIATEMLAEYNAQSDGYDTMITVTRHGNVGDGIDPDTGLPSASILQSQQGRQQSWHLSTTDQRIIYYWRVDSPIVSDTNIALCLGMLPRSLSSVVPTTIDWAKPSLFISQVYYETMTQVRYPAKVVKEDRGAWRAQPTATYEGIAGTWTPDGSFADMNGETWGAGSTGTKYGTQAAKYATIVGNSITVADGDIIPEPYHCRTFTLKQWLNDRLDDTRVSGWSDGRMEMMMMLDWKRDLEVSRVWHHGILWECLVDGTTEEPGYGCTDWQPISGETTLRMNIIGVNGNILGDSLSVIRGRVNETLRGLVMWGQEDVSAKVGAWSWDIIEAGGTVTSNTSNQRQIIVTDSSLPASWTSQGFVTLRANAIIGNKQLTASIKLVNGDISSYEVEFSGYVDVITVDDVGNCIGGLYTRSSENGNEYRDYRIHSAISVRRNGALLICDESDGSSSSSSDEETPADAGTYKIYAEPHGCQCVIENSTIYITSIDNIKDGVAGTPDDANFNYDAMRRMESCSVDLLIDCEGVGTIQKNFPVTIKHDSQPYVGADLTNPFSAVSWNTQTQQYIGLPITFDIKMWHNNQPLDIASTNDVSLTGVVTGMTVTKSIVTITKNQGTANEYSFKVARISITALPASLSPVTEIGITCSAQYSGVSYERTLTHTINKQTDVNVYSLHPSADEVVIGPGGVLSPSSLTCSIYCDSSEHKHYGVMVESSGKNTAHKIYLCWKKEYTDGTTDANYTPYSGAVSVNSSVRRVIFSLFGLINGNPDMSIFHDSKDVPVIAAGEDGPMFYMMGTFSRNTEYSRTTAHVPLVFFDDGEYHEGRGYGNYYYLSPEVQTNVSGNTHYAPAASDRQGNSYNYQSSIWIKAENFGVVITQGLFADFAKMGSAIMSGDYMFSQNGKIGSTVYNDGDTYNSVPAYTYFRGDPDGKFNVGKLNGSTSTSASSQYPNVLNTLSLSKGQTLTVVLNVTSQSGTATIGVRTVGGSSFISSQSWSQGTTAEKTITVTASSVMEVEVVLSTSGQETSVIGSGYYYFSPVFVPNWWVDLKTGKMSAINVDVQGTIRATSFYRNMNFGDNSKVWKHVWSDGTEDITETYYSSGDDAWDSSEGVYLLSQTYYGNADTDIFYVNDEDVFIPNPDNWEGKQVEIYNAGAASNGTMKVKSNHNTRSALMRWPLQSAFSGDLSCGDASYIRMVCRRDNGYNYWYIIEYRKYDGTLYLPNV